MVNNIFLYKRFIGVKKINGHSGVNFSFKVRAEAVLLSEIFAPEICRASYYRSLERVLVVGVHGKTFHVST